MHKIETVRYEPLQSAYQLTPQQAQQLTAHLASQQTYQPAPQRAPQQTSLQATGQVYQPTSQRASHQAYLQAPQQAPGLAPLQELQQSYTQAPQQAYQQAPQQTSQTPGLASQRATHQAYLQTPQQAYQQAPQQTSPQTPQQASPQSSQPASRQKPQRAAQQAAQQAPRRAPQQPSALKDLLFLLIKTAAIALAFILLFTFLFGIVRYQEPSMVPAIKDGDLVIYHRLSQSGYQPNNVVVLEYHGQKQARRVVATAGDTVDITGQGLLINGALQQEPGIYQDTERYAEGIDFPLTVPEGEIFLLGDSRTGATDSRIYGCVKVEDTLGKVMTIIRRRGI
jgi:signal peptidase I